MVADAKQQAKPDWVTQLADRVMRRHQTAADPEAGVVVASGISPSGPIHLGNLRELMVPHFVAEEIRARGVACDHLLSWDDYDRLRKVPAGVPETFAEHIGRPLTAVPDPEGELASYAERFRAPFRRALDDLGVAVREISQTEMYGRGAYLHPVLSALDQRAVINDVLARFRTLEAGATGPDVAGGRDETVLETAGAEEGGPAGEEIGDDYWPYKVYCQACGRDLTRIESVDRTGSSCVIGYRCSACGHHGSFDLFVENHGKLVWKVDWPMRWAYEGVTFEAGGADHSSPGSSFSVGSELVATVFGGRAPEYEAYSFVGIRGMSKLSSSAGAVPTPTDALGVLEVPILRWMYVRKAPRQAITVDLGPGIHSLYDEWDSLSARIERGQATPAQVVTHTRASRTSTSPTFDRPAAIVPFRTLASAVLVAADDDDQIARIVSELTGVAVDAVGETEPRLGLARRWAREYAPEEERFTVRAEPDDDRLASLTEVERRWLELFLADLDEDWSLEGARTLAYGVPKLAAGLPLDSPPTDALKAEQRAFFKLLYQLLLSADTGPRMPTLLMALGRDEVRRLLGGVTTGS